MPEMVIGRDGVRIFSRVDGAQDDAAPAVVFSNALGTDLRLWDKVIALLPPALRLIRYDMRGHGRSDVPQAPYSMGALIADAEAVCDAHRVRDCVFVGLSIGGLVAQGLAVKRLDLMRGLVLSNTAAKIATPALWAQRIKTVQTQGVAALAEDVMARWFGRDFHGTPAMQPWRDMFVATPPEGYAGCCAAISGTDFFATTATLRLPTLGIAGTEDGSTPPDLVKETVDLIPGSRFHLIRRVGHLPCVEDPAAYADILSGFLRDIGHG